MSKGSSVKPLTSLLIRMSIGSLVDPLTSLRTIRMSKSFSVEPHAAFHIINKVPDPVPVSDLDPDPT
jgi:hypothetical protein